MIINDNLAALNTFNALNRNTTAMNQALAELSSGRQINSAADNPSGLTISEQMQSQINGLSQANTNTQDGISLIQTAMGGLTESQSILQSMRELAVQAANGTNTTQDFTAIQDQINQYTSEISAIGNTTQFNTINLLKGGTTAGAVGALTTNDPGGTVVAGQAGVENLTIATALQGNDTLTISGAAGSQTFTAAALVTSGYTTATGQATAIAAAITGIGLSAAASNGVLALTQTSGNYSATQPGFTLAGTGQGVVNGTTAVTGVAQVATVAGQAGVESVTLTSALQGNDTLTISGAAGSQTFTAAALIASGYTTVTGQATAIAAALSGNTTLGLNVTASNGVLTLAQTSGNYSATQPNVTISGANAVSSMLVTAGVSGVLATGSITLNVDSTGLFIIGDSVTISGALGSITITGGTIAGATATGVTGQANNLFNALNAVGLSGIGLTGANDTGGVLTLTQITGGYSATAPTVSEPNGDTGKIIYSAVAGAATPQAGVENVTINTAFVTGDTITVSGATANSYVVSGGTLIAAGDTTATQQAAYIAAALLSGAGGLGLTGSANGATIAITQTTGFYSATAPIFTIQTPADGVVTTSTLTTGVATVTGGGRAGVENVTLTNPFATGNAITISNGSGSITITGGQLTTGVGGTTGATTTGQAINLLAALNAVSGGLSGLNAIGLTGAAAGGVLTLTQITGYYSADNPNISTAFGSVGTITVSGAVGGAAPVTAVTGQAAVENVTLNTALISGDTLTIGGQTFTGATLVAAGFTTATGQATAIAAALTGGTTTLTGLATGATITVTQTSGNYSPTQPTVTALSNTGGAILSTATTGVATVLTTGTAGVETATINAALQGADTLTISGAAGSQTFTVTGGILSGITSATGQAAAIAAALSGNATLGLAVTASNGVLTLAQTTGNYSATQPNVTVAGGGQGAVSNAVVTTGVATDTGEAAYAFGVTTNFGANDQLSINGTNFTAIAGGTAATGQFVVGASLTASAANLATAITAESATLGYTAAASNSGAITLTSTTVGLSSGAPTVALSNTSLATNLQVGANQNQMMAISISDARSAALGVAGTASAVAAGANGNVSGAYFTDGAGNNIMSDYTTAGEGALDVTSQAKASAAITVIDEAISGLSTQNSQLGAYQDRLQDTSDNLTSGSQNLTSANAQLVDVDMASEMSQYTQDSILVQAATAMLAQAQQEPQSVLKLLG